VVQHGVAGGMAVAVVDVLEMVGVDQDQRDRARRAAVAVQLLLGRLEEGAAVGDAGQMVAYTDLRRCSMASRLSLMSRTTMQ
jgi:hypothetical protein